MMMMAFLRKLPLLAAACAAQKNGKSKSGGGSTTTTAGESATHACGYGTNAACPTCPFEASAAPKRVRRELRSLSDDEWDRVVDAMWTMKTMSAADGAALYGASFRNYDALVVKHAVATTDNRGDQAHFGPQFQTWHGAFILEFEMSLLAIDPAIGACPYWDASIDGAFPAYFGSSPGTAANDAVDDGPFAGWTVSAYDGDAYAGSLTGATADFSGSSSTGLLRGTDNTLTNDLFTRFGTTWTYDADHFENCASLASSDVLWYDWYAPGVGVRGARCPDLNFSGTNASRRAARRARRTRPSRSTAGPTRPSGARPAASAATSRTRSRPPTILCSCSTTTIWSGTSSTGCGGTRSWRRRSTATRSVARRR